MARAAKGAVSVDSFGTVSHMSPGGPRGAPVLDAPVGLQRRRAGFEMP